MSATIHPIGGEWGEAVRVANVPGVDEAIRGLLDDPTGDNATMLVREVMREVLRASNEVAIDALLKISALLAYNGKEPDGAAEIVRHVTVATRMNRELGTIIHDNTTAMQAAYIEWQHGEGAEGAMGWIANTLAGPGLIPGDDDEDEDDPIFKDAQGFFDKHSSWNKDVTPDGTMAGKLMASKNDRELLDFMGRAQVLIDHLTDDDGSTRCIVYAPESLDVLGRGATTREALREAVRKLDPQADLFAGESE